MLVLGRKINQQIVIGENNCLTVDSIRGAQVRLGVEAPSSIPISREALRAGYSPLELSAKPPALIPLPAPSTCPA
jgi:carbon storage regulator